jgi:glycosyltransferase involved in cell wall biosynthesis
MEMSKEPVVVIYRHYLLQPSETFVRSQAEALQRFTPYYMGLRLMQGLPLPDERTLVVNRGGLLGRISEVSAKLWGFSTPLVKQVQNLNPALIHAHFGQDAAMVLPLAKDLQVPLLVTFHGYDATVRDAHAERSLAQRIYFRRRESLKREARLFIAVSEFIKKKLLEQGFPPDKIVVHYIGIDTKQFQPDPTVPREPVVLFVGRLVEKKGCEYLIQSMSRVQAAMPEVELVIIGDGRLRSYLENLAKEKLQRYQFLGVQPPEIVKTWMNRAKVFCVPSITAKSGDAEGFGIVFTEAQAMGLPVVSFVSGGIPEAVAHGKTGFLVAERDSEGLSAYILRFLADEELWRQFSQSGQERVCTIFNLYKQTRVLENIYVDRVLDGKV